MRDGYFQTLRRMCGASEDDLATCGLVFAELVVNAVRHAPGALSLSLERRGDDVLLHVIDRGPGFDYQPALPRNLWSEGGRGLFLVSQLAKAVHVERLTGIGGHVTVTLPVTCAAIPNGRAT